MTCPPPSGDLKAVFLNRNQDLNICPDKTPLKWQGTLVFCSNACIVNDIERKIHGRKGAVY